MTTPDPGRDDHMERSRFVPPKEAITGGFSNGADLISYIVAGLLIGLFLDWITGWSPIMTILWSLAGVGVGFYRLWQRSEDLEAEGRARSHGV